MKKTSQTALRTLVLLLWAVTASAASILLQSAPRSTALTSDVVVADLLNDNFEDRSIGNVSLTSVWTSKGYTDFIANSVVEITGRAGAPTELLADPRVPSSKTRFLHIRLGGTEQQNRILWEGYPTGVRSACASWYEYRPNDNLGGEKFFRTGNTLPSSTNRGHDIIVGLSDFDISDNGNIESIDDFTIFPNSEQMFGFPLQSVPRSVVPTWPPGLAHFEVCTTLSSTATSSDGSVELWVEGVRVLNAQGLRMNADAGDALRDLSLIDWGGWSSTGAVNIVPGSYEYPIDRWYVSWKVSTTRLGPWPIDTN